jgi:hypothetical protein
MVTNNLRSMTASLAAMNDWWNSLFQQKPRHCVGHRTWSCQLQCEPLEDRSLMDATIYNALGSQILVKSNGVADAAPIQIKLNGAVQASGAKFDQVVFKTNYKGTGTDFRAYFEIDTNGLISMRPYDINNTAANAAPFGTNIKLPLGLITNNGGSETDFLSAQVDSINIITTNAAAGRFQLVITGEPASGPTAAAHTTAPGVAVTWTVNLMPPLGETTFATIQTTATFNQQITLSSSAMSDAQAFRAFEFSSSNVPADHTSSSTATHDADQLIITDAPGTSVTAVNLTSQDANALFFSGGQALTYRVELNQLNPAPLNMPNVSASIVPAPDNAAYHVQGYKTVDSSTDENSANLGVWISRDLAGATITAGTKYSWTVNALASDAVPTAANSDLYADFGASGVTSYTSSGATKLTPNNPQSIVAANNGDLFGDFGANGVWHWTSADGWQKISTGNAESMVVAGNGSLFADFGTAGLWRWTASTGFLKLDTANADQLATFSTTGNGDVFADFGTQGLWHWTTTGGWRKINTANAQNIVAANTGDLYADFGSQGLWRWTTAGWTKLNTANAETMTAASNGDLYVDFGTQGLWRWTTAGWSKLSTANADSLTVAGNGDLFVDYGSLGLWRWTTTTGWKKLSNNNAQNIVAANDGTLYADFGATGLWQWDSSAGWQKLSSLNPETLAVARNGEPFLI